MISSAYVRLCILVQVKKGALNVVVTWRRIWSDKVIFPTGKKRINISCFNFLAYILILTE